MMQLVLHGLRENTEEQWGVEVVDVRIKRADFPTAAEASVFDRMRSERSVQAQRLRAEGEEQFLTITADVSRTVRIIRADADRDANILSGEGEARPSRYSRGFWAREPCVQRPWTPWMPWSLYPQRCWTTLGLWTWNS